MPVEASASEGQLDGAVRHAAFERRPHAATVTAGTTSRGEQSRCRFMRELRALSPFGALAGVLMLKIAVPGREALELVDGHSIEAFALLQKRGRSPSTTASSGRFPIALGRRAACGFEPSGHSGSDGRFPTCPRRRSSPQCAATKLRPTLRREGRSV